jgi:hypothetical protein
MFAHWFKAGSFHRRVHAARKVAMPREDVPNPITAIHLAFNFTIAVNFRIALIF